MKMNNYTAKLAVLNKRSSNAISLVNSTINDLEKVNNEITKTLGEIEAEQTKLADTKENLLSTMSDNSNIISNFRSLLGR
jgi:flagellar hook-associated protein FlgK